MTQTSSVGKISYIYDQPTNTWYPLAGMTDSSADFSWTGDHNFSAGSDVTIDGKLLSRSGINYFESISDRNEKIPSPSNGVIALVLVNNIIQVQYYSSGQWRLVGSNAQIEERTSANFTSNNRYSLSVSDSGKTLEFNASVLHIVTIPLDSTINFPIGSQIAFIQSGTGQTTFEGESSPTASVNILSKLSNKKIASRYSQAIVVKKAANTWFLMGDLTA
jgi:hypothetical protein